jgi:MHS family alpha-ketoglutarate permease-like MFS transporter
MLQARSLNKDSSINNKHPLKAVVGGAAGNLVEWYDWYAYSAFSLYFAEAFFPQENLTAQLLNTAGIFAVGFLMRPIGGWLFGTIADRKGRKKAMTSSVLLMSFGSFLIAVSPSYHTAGIVAPVLLLLARLLQGLSVGGEYGTSATYLSEVGFAHRRGFYSSFQYVTLIGGQLIALGLLLLLQRFFLTPAELHVWGWRIPFFLGALLSLVALYLRSNLEETAAFEQRAKSVARRGTIRELLKYPRAIVTVVGLTLGGTIAFYTFSTYMQKFLVNTVGLSKDTATLLLFLCLFLFALLQPVFGLLSDRIGRRPLLLAFGLLATLFTVPLLHTLSRETEHWKIVTLMMLALIMVSGYTSINAVVKAELFPAEVRALGVGLPYAITVAVFGGSAEYIALYLKNIGHENWYFWFVSACTFISFIVYLNMKETRTHSMMDKDRLRKMS